MILFTLCLELLFNKCTNINDSNNEISSFDRKNIVSTQMNKEKRSIVSNYSDLCEKNYMDIDSNMNEMYNMYLPENFNCGNIDINTITISNDDTEIFKADGRKQSDNLYLPQNSTQNTLNLNEKFQNLQLFTNTDYEANLEKKNSLENDRHGSYYEPKIIKNNIDKIDTETSKKIEENKLLRMFELPKILLDKSDPSCSNFSTQIENVLENNFTGGTKDNAELISSKIQVQDITSSCIIEHEDKKALNFSKKNNMCKKETPVRKKGKYEFINVNKNNVKKFNVVAFQTNDSFTDNENLKFLSIQYYKYKKRRFEITRSHRKFKSVEFQLNKKDISNPFIDNNVDMSSNEVVNPVRNTDTSEPKNIVETGAVNLFSSHDPRVNILLTKIKRFYTKNSSVNQSEIDNLTLDLLIECNFHNPNFKYDHDIFKDFGSGYIFDHCESLKKTLENIKLEEYEKISQLVFKYLEIIHFQRYGILCIDERIKCHDFFFGKYSDYKSLPELDILKSLVPESTTIINSFDRKKSGNNCNYAKRYFIWNTIIILIKKIYAKNFLKGQSMWTRDFNIDFYNIRNLIRKLSFYILADTAGMDQKTYLYFQILLIDTIFLEKTEDIDYFLVNTFMKNISNILYENVINKPLRCFKFNNELVEYGLNVVIEFRKTRNYDKLNELASYLHKNLCL